MLSSCGNDVNKAVRTNRASWNKSEQRHSSRAARCRLLPLVFSSADSSQLCSACVSDIVSWERNKTNKRQQLEIKCMLNSGLMYYLNWTNSTRSTGSASLYFDLLMVCDILRSLKKGGGLISQL